jgi:cytoskeletal protein RodZ
MNPTDEVAAKPEVSERQSTDAGAGSDAVLRKFDERFRATLKDLQRMSDQRKPGEDVDIPDGQLNERLSDLPPQPSPQRKFAEDVQNILSQISHHLDHETSERAAIHRRLVAIETEVKKRGSRGSRGFLRYLIAICLGAAAVLAWQAYGAATQALIATRAPDLGWSPESKEMIASWVQQLGLAKPPAGPDSNAVGSSAPQSPQSPPVEAAAGSAATVSAAAGSVAPDSVTPKTSSAATLDPQKAQQIEADIAAARQTAEEQLGAVRQSVEQLAAGQDRMAGEITRLQAADQEILARIPAPPPPPRRTDTSAHKPKPLTLAPARTPPPHP